MYPQRALGANYKGRMEFSKNGKNLQCPTFFTPWLLFTQRIKCLTCHMKSSEAILLLMYRKKTKTMSLDSNMPKKGSCNLLSNLFTLVCNVDTSCRNSWSPDPASNQTTARVFAVTQAVTITLIICYHITNLP